MQEAKVAGSPETLGQHVLQEQRQETRPAQRAHRTLAGLAVAIAKADLACLAGEDVLLLDDAPIQVAAQIDQGLAAIANAFAIHHPVCRHTGRQLQALAGERGQHLGAKHLGQGTVVEQVSAALATAASPQTLLRVQGGAWHGQVNMRVVIKATRMGMQHGHRTGLPLQLPVVPAKEARRCPRALEEYGVEGALMLPGQLA